MDMYAKLFQMVKMTPKLISIKNVSFQNTPKPNQWLCKNVIMNETIKIILFI